MKLSRSYPLGDGIRFRRPEWMPEYFWRRSVRIRAFHVAALVILLAALAIVHLLRNQLGWIGLFIVLVMIPERIVWTFWPRRLRRRIIKELEQHDDLVCLTCGYPLDGLPVEHRCPECGSAYHADEVRNAWKHWAFYGKLPTRMPPRGNSSGSR